MEEQNDEIKETIKNCEEQPQDCGSSVLKFSCIEELEKAYQNLEREFTKKSQLLSEMLKKEQQKVDEPNKTEVGLPFFERENWALEVQDFLSKNPQAKPYAKEISQIAIEDKELQFCNNPLLVAWQKWLTKNYKTTEQLLEDEKFLKDVKNNEKIKKAIISDYINDLKSREVAPPIYSDSGFCGTNVKYGLSSLEEAKELAKKIFNK